MLEFLDKLILSLISWLYLKHTTIFLKLEARRAAEGGLYTPPVINEQVEHALAEFGITVEQLGSTGGLYRATNIDAQLKA